MPSTSASFGLVFRDRGGIPSRTRTSGLRSPRTDRRGVGCGRSDRVYVERRDRPCRHRASEPLAFRVLDGHRCRVHGRRSAAFRARPGYTPAPQLGELASPLRPPTGWSPTGATSRLPPGARLLARPRAQRYRRAGDGRARSASRTRSDSTTATCTSDRRPAGSAPARPTRSTRYLPSWKRTEAQPAPGTTSRASPGRRTTRSFQTCATRRMASTSPATQLHHEGFCDYLEDRGTRLHARNVRQGRLGRSPRVHRGDLLLGVDVGKPDPSDVEAARLFYWKMRWWSQATSPDLREDGRVSRHEVRW